MATGWSPPDEESTIGSLTTSPEDVVKVTQKAKAETRPSSSTTHAPFALAATRGSQDIGSPVKFDLTKADNDGDWEVNGHYSDDDGISTERSNASRSSFYYQVAAKEATLLRARKEAEAAL